MKHAIIIGLLTVAIVAAIIALKVFVFVFMGMLQYGLFALVLACLIYLWIRSKFKKDKDDVHNG